MRFNRSSTWRRSRKRGISLIESVVAVSILATYIGGACRLSLATRMLTDEARERYQAVTLAKNRLERIRVLPYDQFDLLQESSVRVNHAGAPTRSGRFLRTTEVTDLGADAKEIVVSVAVRNRVTLRFDRSPEEVTSCIARFQTEPPTA